MAKAPDTEHAEDDPRAVTPTQTRRKRHELRAGLDAETDFVMVRTGEGGPGPRCGALHDARPAPAPALSRDEPFHYLRVGMVR